MAYKADQKFIDTLADIPPHEPIMILRGQDVSAPRAIVSWIHDNIYNGNMPDAKLREAFECALKMRHFTPRKAAD